MSAAQHRGYPPRTNNPFLKRVERTIDEWVETEWTRKEKIISCTVRHAPKSRAAALAAATLTPERLAAQIDNISLSKLRRELSKVGAPSPGQLIRDARIAYATRLLIETRLMIREVRERAGYDNEKHFTTTFINATGLTPSEYRRQSIAKKPSGSKS